MVSDGGVKQQFLENIYAPSGLYAHRTDPKSRQDLFEQIVGSVIDGFAVQDDITRAQKLEQSGCSVFSPIERLWASWRGLNIVYLLLFQLACPLLNLAN